MDGTTSLVTKGDLPLEIEQVSRITFPSPGLTIACLVAATMCAGCSTWNFGSLHAAKSAGALSAWMESHTPIGTPEPIVKDRVESAGAWYGNHCAALQPPWWQPTIYPYTKWIHFYFDEQDRLARAEIAEWNGDRTAASLSKR